ncbi:hypothetical protein [Beijerinckia mobilis]|uniref:hypothetical protein n=1 Tax=Beijerinckia mobilis TaxID=231434 RepID=UPI00054DE659|nr:hypothetical protein [Beijerinckia mobilis]
MPFKIILSRLDGGFIQDIAVTIDPEPALTGSPKQIAWAQQIRRAQLLDFRRNRLKDLMLVHGWFPNGEPDIRLPSVRSATAPLPGAFTRAIALCEQTLNADQQLVDLFGKTAASFWIDHRKQSLFDPGLQEIPESKTFSP